MQLNRKGRKARKESPGISKSGEVDEWDMFRNILDNRARSGL
jgi:hypothetical protein